MFTLKIENSLGQIFELTHDTTNYAVIGIQGLTPPPTNINTATSGTTDGTFFNSARVEQRNIVIDIILRGDIEGNRQRLYQIFPRKMPCTIYFANKNRNVKIQGYVETLEGDLFVQQEQIQISIICPRPYFEDLDYVYGEISKTLRLFQFPFSISTPIPFSEALDTPLGTIVNNGDVETGLEMKVLVTGAVTGLTIYNTTTQKFFGINYSFEAQDLVTINTISGQLSVSLTRGVTVTNLLNYVTANSEWIKLAVGENSLTFTTTNASEDDVDIKLQLITLRGGV